MSHIFLFIYIVFRSPKFLTHRFLPLKFLIHKYLTHTSHPQTFPRPQEPEQGEFNTSYVLNYNIIYVSE
jgi:hypothetical protein